MPIAEDFLTFLSLVAATKDAGALECIGYSTREGYNDYINGIEDEQEAVKKAITAIRTTFLDLRNIPDVYEHVKFLQVDNHLSILSFKDDYYNSVDVKNRRLDKWM